jgi:hypothetical protein
MQRAQQVHRVFEGDLRLSHQRAMRLEGLAQQRAASHVGRWFAGPEPAAVDPDGLWRDQPEQAADAGEHGRLAPHAQRAGEKCRLARRLATMPRHPAAARLVQVGAIKLADTVVREASPCTDSVRARLVVDET